MEIIRLVLKNVLMGLYQYFWVSLLMAALVMLVWLLAGERSFKSIVRLWVDEFKKSPKFRRMFVFAFYALMILNRTLFCRETWKNPLSDVLGPWSLYNNDGKLITDTIENFILFLPFVFLLFWCFRPKIFKGGITFSNTLWKGFLAGFLVSLSIELFQLILCLGTFQISDIFFNTLGGIAGSFCFYIFSKIKKDV